MAPSELDFLWVLDLGTENLPKRGSCETENAEKGVLWSGFGSVKKGGLSCMPHIPIVNPFQGTL